MAKSIRRGLRSKVEITTRSASENAFPSIPQFALNADSGFDIVKVKRDFEITGYEYYYTWWEDFDFPFNNKDSKDPFFVNEGVVPEFDRYAEALYMYFDLDVQFYQELPLPMGVTKAKKYAKDNGMDAVWELCLVESTPKLVPHEVVVNWDIESRIYGVIDEEWETHTSYVGEVTPISQADYDLFDLLRTATSNFNYYIVGGVKYER